MNRTLLIIVMASILFMSTVALTQTVNAGTYNCTLQLNGKGCVIAQKAKGDIKNTINLVVSGTSGGGTPSGNGTDYSGDINQLKGDVSALKATTGKSIAVTPTCLIFWR